MGLTFDYDSLKMKNGVFYDIRKLKAGDISWHNGYIFLNNRKDMLLLKEVIERIVEVTYEDDFKIHELGETYKVLGFDTVHLYNIRNPKMQTYSAVENTIYEIFEEYDRLFYKERR